MQTHDKGKILFDEPYAAAQSLKNIWTRLASTYGCIRVMLSADTLTIKPHWYAGWILWILCLDLFHQIDLNKIVEVREIGRWFNRGKVEVRYKTPEGNNRIIWLYLKKDHELKRAYDIAKGH